MKMYLLIATGDTDYAEHLSKVLLEKYQNKFEITVCFAKDKIREALQFRRFNVALLDVSMAEGLDTSRIILPVLLWQNGENNTINGKRIKKYQRISNIASEIMMMYAEMTSSESGNLAAHGKVTLVWSPSGGSGKTSVAMAYAIKKAAIGQKIAYLNFEFFSSVPAFFPCQGKSISVALEKIENNLELLMESIRYKDDATGIYYYIPPENYDDVNILTTSDVVSLAQACSTSIDEVIVDVSSVCDDRMRQAMDLADRIFVVVDATKISQIKWKQFQTQNNVYQDILHKIILIGNRGAVLEDAGLRKSMVLPVVHQIDPILVCKALANNMPNL